MEVRYRKNNNNKNEGKKEKRKKKENRVSFMKNKGQRNLVNTINKRDEKKKTNGCRYKRTFFFLLLLCTIVGSSKR